MVFEYAVTVLNLDSDWVLVDCFMATDEDDARHSFQSHYNGNYKILSAVPTGRM